MPLRAVRVRVIGRVQGVAFRAWAVDQAQARGLRGWVRNRRDGSVEALIGGEDEAVAAMLDALRRGPPASRVDAVRTEAAEAAALPGSFRQEPTA